MRAFTLLVVILTTGSASAGELGTLLPWITEPTAAANLMLNNNDYQGTFEASPNKFKLNQLGNHQSIVSTERLVPTRVSGGVTEFAVMIGGSYSDDDARPGVTLDSRFQVQLGFGTGANFVRASTVAPNLVFDHPSQVSPAIEDYKFFIGNIPILKLLSHQGDRLVYQGSSTSGVIGSINFVEGALFKLPLDIPDLPATARNFYSAAELQGLAATDIPFTIRVSPVPEPAAAVLACFGVACLVALRRRKRRAN